MNKWRRMFLILYKNDFCFNNPYTLHKQTIDPGLSNVAFQTILYLLSVQWWMMKMIWGALTRKIPSRQLGNLHLRSCRYTTFRQVEPLRQILLHLRSCRYTSFRQVEPLRQILLHLNLLNHLTRDSCYRTRISLQLNTSQIALRRRGNSNRSRKWTMHAIPTMPSQQI